METHAFGAAGILVLPLTHSIGVRFRLGALGSEANSDSQVPFFGTGRFWYWQVDTAVDLFVRDPDIGHFDIGYRFAHQESREDTRPTVESHSFTASAGLFTNGFGIVPVDLETSFQHSRIHRNDFDEIDFDDFTPTGLLRIHAHRRLRLDLGTRWQLSEPPGRFLGDRYDVRGVAEFLWLPALSRNDDSNYVTFRIFGTGAGNSGLSVF